MKAVQRPAEVTVQASDQTPQSFVWRDQRHTVGTVLDRYRIGGRWWMGETPSTAYLVEAGGVIAELHRSDDGTWWLVSVVD